MRKQIFIRIANPEIKNGYIPKLNAGPQVYLGNAVVSNHHGVTHLYAVNSSDEDIELAVPTVKIYPFEEIREEIKENFNNKRDNDDERVNKILQLLRLDYLNEEEVTSATSLVTSCCTPDGLQR
ncbi:hypothetical protein P5V15_012807 [Pogonomyrmex californicus]